MYYLLLESLEKRTEVIAKLKEQNINTVFHYVPLHSSPAGKKYARTHGELPHTVDLSDRLLRLPLWVGMSDTQNRVIDEVYKVVN